MMLEKADEFLESLSVKAKNKIMYNVTRVELGLADKTVFKKLEGHDLWEVRTRYFGNTYRLLCFFDKYTGRLVVATSGFMKKTQKTPSQEIELAEQIMRQYYIDKYPKK